MTATPARRLKIAVVGNCQSAGIADCINLLAPGVVAMPFMVHLIPQARRQQAFEQLRKYDVLLSQPVKSFGPLNTDNLLTLGRPVLTFPNVYFRGYMPDICFIGPGGERVRTPLANNNSFIIAESYVRGLDTASCRQRFNPDTYAELGYPSAWQESLDTLAAREADLDVKVSHVFREPAASPNLYVSNHPKLPILFDLARQALQLLGRNMRQGLSVDCIPDRLRDGSIWPVYGTGRQDQDTPPDAMRFKASGMTYLTLDAFIAASYAAYEKAGLDRMVLSSPPELVTLFNSRQEQHA